MAREAMIDMRMLIFELHPPALEQEGLVTALRVRLAAVFTEIENLPVYEGNGHAWVLRLCQSSRRCARACPPDAFYEDPIMHENGLVTVLDNGRCFPYFAKNHGCSICIKVCPFNQQGYDKIKRGFLKQHATATSPGTI